MEFLIGVLHLHNEFLAILPFAIYIEDGLTVYTRVAQMFVVQVLHVPHHLGTVEQTVQKAYQQLLVGSPTGALPQRFGMLASLYNAHGFHSLADIVDTEDVCPLQK